MRLKTGFRNSKLRLIDVSTLFSGLALSLLVTAGCTKSEPKSQISIQLPGKASAQSALKTGTGLETGLETEALGDSEWDASVPASLSEIGCYAVFIGGPEASMSGDSCKDPSGNVLMKYGLTAGLFSAGSTAVIDVPSGNDRRFYILGMKLVNGQCELVMPASHELTFSNYTHPYLVGEARANIQPGENTLAVNLVEQFTDANKADDCSFMRAREPVVVAPTPAPYFAAAELALGQNHTCARLTDGRVKCWGMAGSGQLGGLGVDKGAASGDMGNALPFVDLGTGRTAQAIGAGNNFTCAHLDNDTIKCWGANGVGQLGRGNADPLGISAGQMGESLAPVSIGTGRTVKQMAVGESHVCVIRDNDSVVCWGKNDKGQLGVTLSYPTIGAATGQMGDTLTPVSFGGKIPTQISAGFKHTCARMSDSTSMCWGDNMSMQFGDGTTTSSFTPVNALATNVIKVVAGSKTTCWRMADNSHRCAGINSTGNYGNGNTTASSSAPTSIIGLSAVSDLSVGDKHACAVDGGSAYCWGGGFLGRTGLNSTTNVLVPNVVPLLTSVMKVFTAGSTTGGHSCAITTEGRVKCWGDNTYGQLGYEHGDTLGDGLGDAMEALPYVNVGSME